MTALTVASTVTAVLSLTGCASSRKSAAAKEAARTEARDSAVSETRRVTVEAVPAAEVGLSLKADSLLALPAGASYHARSGRASLDVRKGAAPGTIVVRATCDSLQRLAEYYERLAAGYKATLERRSEEVKEEEKPPGAWRKIMEAFIAGILAGTVITLKTKRQNEK